MKKLLLASLLTVLTHFSVFSSTLNLASIIESKQDTIVRGKILDESGMPLTGATILEVGTKNGVVSDFDGNFSIKVQSRTSSITVSYIGYEDQTFSAKQEYIEVQLLSGATLLDEAIVIGYGSIKKSDITGSIASVSSEDLNQFPTASPIEAMQGRAAGVSISSLNGGEPGADFRIRIRGNTSISSSNNPLFVVDGIPQGSLPPSDDIASMEILKDASATAIYGSRGANGVVLITTKKGKSGKMKVNLNITYASQKEIKRYDLLNAQQYGEYINELDALSGISPTFPNPSELGVGTDWQEEISQKGMTENYNLSFSGGSEKINYYLSGTVYDQKGVVLSSNYKRYSITSNVNAKVSDRFNVGINIFSKRTNSNRASTKEGSSGSQGGGVLTSALTFTPTVGVYEDDGTYSFDTFQPLSDNAVAISNERTDDYISDNFQSSVFGEYKILDNLKFKSVLGITVQNDFRGRYQSSKLVYGGSQGGIASISNAKRTNILSENYFTYSQSFNDKHELTILGGYSYQKFEKLNSRASSSGFLTDSSLYYNLGSGSTSNPPSSSFEDSNLISYYARANYNYKNKYLLTATLRRDGSSVLSEGNEWENFPSAALGWNLHEEEFLSDSNIISQMKFRASYGISGNNQSVQPYSSLARLRSVGAVYNGVQVSAVSPQTLSNHDLKWERTSQSNIGLDVGLFHSRVSIVADYYNMTTSDLLFSTPIPRYLGVGNTALKNIGETGNKGFEFSVGVKDIVKIIHWNSNFNISFNKNSVNELPDGEDIFYQSGRPGGFVGINNTQILKEGEPIGLFYGYVYDGVQQAGDVLLTNAEGLGGEKFRDLNNDGILDADNDRMIIGDPNPDFNWGWNNSFSYKGIDLNIFLLGVQGNDILNYTKLLLEDGVSRKNASTSLLNRWTPTNTDTDVPNASITRTQSLSSRWIEDGSYVRLKTITLGYTLPSTLTEKLKVSSLRFYINGENLWTKTDYSGFDPEVGRGGSIEGIGVDYGSYPNTKNILLGINLSF